MHTAVEASQAKQKKGVSFGNAAIELAQSNTQPTGNCKFKIIQIKQWLSRSILKKSTVSEPESDGGQKEISKIIPSEDNQLFKVLKETHRYWDKLTKFDQEIEKSVESLLEAQQTVDNKNKIFTYEIDDIDVNNKRIFQKYIDEQPQIKLREKTTRFIELQNDLTSRFSEYLKKNLQADLKEGDKKNFHMCILNLLQDALNLRKIQLIGSKMRIYQERLRATNLAVLLQSFSQDNNKILDDSEKHRKIFEACVKIGKKMQMTMTASMDYYAQAHLQQTSLSSMALGVLTSSVF